MSHPSGQRTGLLRRWPWALLVCALGILIAAPFVVRMALLSGISDAGDPFDVVEFSTVEVPSSQNAYDFYRQAAARLVPGDPQIAETCTVVVESGWTAATPELEQWLDSNRPALDLYREGSECPDALYHLPRDGSITTLIPITFNLREFARMAQVQALRQTAAGDLAGAWDWYRVMLRSSRHPGMHGFLVERLTGSMIHAMASSSIVGWAAHPGVNEALLRTALEELRSIDAMTAPLSTSLKTEYIATMNTLARPDLVEGLRDKRHPVEDLLPRQSLNLVMGEPDRSRQLIRQMFAELLEVCDIPRPERFNRGGEDNPGAAIIGARMVSAELEQEILRAPVASLFHPQMGAMIAAVDRERARELLLETALRLQIYHRRNGAFPQTLEELAADGLGEIPIDPFGTGTPIRFRLEKDPAQGVIIWSIERDGIDQQGRVKTEGVTDDDLIMLVKPPREVVPESHGAP